MTATAIYTLGTRKTLFSGDFASVCQCLETAVAQRISLQSSDLRMFSLAHANLDGADLRGANLSASNLFGANLSESDLTGATIADSDLGFACLAECRLHNVDFTNSTFASTVLTGATVSECVFSCPTALSLPFGELASIGCNTYFHDNTTPYVFAAAPVVITGLPRKIVVLDDVVLIGNRVAKRPKTILSSVEDLCRAYG